MPILIAHCTHVAAGPCHLIFLVWQLATVHVCYLANLYWNPGEPFRSPRRPVLSF